MAIRGNGLARRACIGSREEAGQAMRGPCAALLVVLAVAPAIAADPVVQWDAAEQHVGEQAIVEGRVLGVHCSPTSCLLAFDPTFNRFTVVVQAKDFNKFPPDQLDNRYSGKRVRVRGTIVDRDRKPEIEVADPANLKLVETKQDRQEKTAKASDAQDQVLQRLDAVLDRVEALTERLVELQGNMQSLMAQMEATNQALMVLATPPPAPPPEGPAGPEPRPGWESMRSVKRGMSAGDVRRLMGDPQNVVPGGNGWSTWLYDDGRMISFDGRGRAQSLAGFPGP
jgi:hypothetical protein